MTPIERYRQALTRLVLARRAETRAQSALETAKSATSQAEKQVADLQRKLEEQIASEIDKP